MKRLLITGATGMLGSALVEQLSNSYDVFTTSRSKLTQGNPDKHIIFDLNDRDISKLIDFSDPKVLIHCGAITSIDYCEKHKKESKIVNFDFIKRVVELEKQIKIVFISSDAVFAESKHNQRSYIEESKTAPMNYYGRLKLKSENVVLEKPENLVIRCTPVGMTNSDINRSFCDIIIKNSLIKKEMLLFKDVLFTPISIWRLSKEIEHMIKNDLNGTYHLSSSEITSKYDFGIRLCEKLGISTVNLKSDLKKKRTDLTNRLNNQSLSSIKYFKKTRRKLGNIDEVLSDFKKNFTIEHYEN